MTVTITPLPTPPSSSDPATFDARADALNPAIVTMVGQANNQNVENNSINANVNAKVQAALDAGLANAAANAGIATTKAGESSTSAGQALASKNAAAQSALDAKAQADAAVATSGLPNLAGKGGQFMRANAAGTAFELTPGGTLVRDARTTNTALTLADIGKWVDITANTFAQTFASSSTLAAGWWCRVTNTGTGQITLTPNGAELIDGAATRVINPGDRRVIQCDGTTLRTVSAVGNLTLARRNILSAAAAASYPFGTGESLASGIYYPGASTAGTYAMLASNGTNFVCSSWNSSNVIASSPDGKVWTNRTAIGTDYWVVASDGVGFLAVGSSNGFATKSTNGVTWTSATTAPANSMQTFVGLSGGAYAGVNGNTSVFYTPDSGTTWATNTAPVAIGRMVAAAGFFVAIPSVDGSTYYTSTTTATGSWTSRTFPTGVTSVYGNVRRDFDGSLIGSNGSTGAAWRSTDGFTWVQVASGLSQLGGNGFMTINGVILSGNTSASGFSTIHNGRSAIRLIGVSGTANTTATTNLGGPGVQYASLGNTYLITNQTTNPSVLLFDGSTASTITSSFEMP